MATAVATPSVGEPPTERPSGQRPLRVCMVHYSDFHVDSRIQRQARALAERGDEVDLVCLSPAGELTVGEGRIRIHEVPVGKAGGGALAYLRGYGAFFARALWTVSRLERRRRYDVVEAHNMPDFLTATAALPKLRGAAVILNVHDTLPELYATKFGVGPEHPLVRGLRLEEAASARLADAVITVTDKFAEILAERGVGVDHTTIVMNTPDHTLFGPPRPARPLPADGPLRVLYHGGLAPRFGADLLIEAVGGLVDERERLELRICGTGDEHQRLIALARELAPGRADVAPVPVPLAQIPAELEAAQIGVVPTRQ
ncbi:MAG TPA: glycosyltransferase, partial [Thermoleophilaceae bacterium]